MPPSESDARIGSTVAGRFRLDDLLGVGGMGKVYVATQLSVDRRVALKVLHDEVVEDPQARGRFLREAQTVASIAHPGIVQLVDFGEDDELEILFLAMEFVEGVPLSSVMKMGALRPEVAVEVARQIAAALAQAHRAGIVHRDLKPDNVMLVVTADGALQAKILDFGIALPSTDETRLTSTGAIVGTPHYMSPEQAQDQPVGPATDIYALGIILYEMVTGKLPFVADTPLALLFKHVQQEAPMLSEVKPDTPRILDDLVAEMLAKAPNDRPGPASELASRLVELQSRLGTFDTGPLEVGSTRPETMLPLVDVRRATTEAEDVFGRTAASEPGGLHETTETADDHEPVASIRGSTVVEESAPGLGSSGDARGDEDSVDIETGSPGAAVGGNRKMMVVALFLLVGVGVAAWFLAAQLRDDNVEPTIAETSPATVDGPSGSSGDESLDVADAIDDRAKGIVDAGLESARRAERVERAAAPERDEESEPVPKDVVSDQTDPDDPLVAAADAEEVGDDPHRIGPRVDDVEIPDPSKLANKKPVQVPKIPPPTDDDTLARRNRKLGGMCRGDDRCQFDGLGKPGSAVCMDNSTCVARCPIGECIQFCQDEATCYFSCEGGNCNRMKGPNATIHEFED